MAVWPHRQSFFCLSWPRPVGLGGRGSADQMSLWAFRAGQNARELLAWGPRGSRAPSAVRTPGTRGAHCRCSTSHPQRPLAARGGGAVQGRNGQRGEASVGEGPPTFPTREANKTLSNQPACAPDSGLRPPHSHPPPPWSTTGVVPSAQGVFGVSREVKGSTLPSGNSRTRTWGEERGS